MAISNIRNSVVAIGLWFLAYLISGLAVQAQEPFDALTQEKLPTLSKTVSIPDGRTPNVFPDQTTTRWVWRYTHETEVGFLRLHIRVRHFSAVNGWFLLVKDAANNEVERVRPSSFFGDPPNVQFWTKRIDGNKVRVELHSELNPVGLDLEIDRLMYEFFIPGPRAITTGRNDMQDLVRDFTRTHVFYNYSLPISAIFFVKVTGTEETNCTGFLLTPQIIITNQHCISQPWQLNGARVIFNYENNPPQQETFGVRSIAMQNRPLDFTLLELDRPATAWPTVKIDQNLLTNGQQLVLIEHPNKKFKIVSIKECDIEKVVVDDLPNRGNDFYHRCDTEWGASGSPVMNRATGRVVGLHHDGISDPVYNRGRNLAVNIRAILEQIRSENKVLHAEIVKLTQ